MVDDDGDVKLRTTVVRCGSFDSDYEGTIE